MIELTYNSFIDYENKECIVELNLKCNDIELNIILKEYSNNLKQLLMLDLSYNNLQNIPPEIGNLTQLQILQLNNNNL